jgi:hypothetical protein
VLALEHLHKEQEAIYIYVYIHICLYTYIETTCSVCWLLSISSCSFRRPLSTASACCLRSRISASMYAAYEVACVPGSAQPTLESRLPTRAPSPPACRLKMLLRCQYLYFCTSKASKLSTEPLILRVLSGVECAFFFYFYTSKASKLSTEPLILRVLSGVECAFFFLLLI